MRVVLDTCISRKVETILTLAGHEVVSIGDLPEDPGDDVILAGGPWPRNEF